MRHVAILMSDFHLGVKDRYEEFWADEEYAELLSRLSLTYAEDEVDLILNGDVMDLWTTNLDPREQQAEVTSEIFLSFPARTEEERAQAATIERQKVEAITAAHRGYFEALGLFLADAPEKRRLIYLPGNHDHSVVDPRVQEAVRASLISPCVLKRLRASNVSPAALQGQLLFQAYYYNTTLQVYAEHGNQLTYGGVFRYADFPAFGEECPGYFQFKLVSNRMERRAPELNSVFMEAFQPAMWPGILWWLLIKGHFRTFTTLGLYQRQYQADTRCGPTTARAELPSPWKTLLHLLSSQWFGLTHDEFANKVLRLFDANQTEVVPLTGKALDAEQIRTVVMGHSHQSRSVALPGLEGLHYFNTGGWLMRYENGRRVVEQTWVTIMKDHTTDDASSSVHREVIHREMVRRRVERSQSDSIPISSAEGRALNPTTLLMPDLKVGDVVLFRWNFGPTLTRLFTGFHWKTLLTTLWNMIPAWCNRIGTSSAWNHAALVYASPTEREESDAYHDPLFLEAVPNGGVGIHGPQHYFEHPTDWDVAVLRLKASWLEDPDPKIGWPRRRLLRRVALGNLQAHYANGRIIDQTKMEVMRSMDQRGKSFIGGLLKGVIGGCLLAIPVIPFLFYYHFGQVGPWAHEEHWVGPFADRLVPGIKWSGLVQFFNHQDIWLQSIAIALTAVLAILVVVTTAGLVLVFVAVWLGTLTGIGAIWGALLVPPLAEIANGWTRRSSFTRWSITILWLLIPLLFMILIAFISTNPAELLKFCTRPASCAWASLELLVGYLVVSILAIIVLTFICLPLFELLVRAADVGIVRPYRAARTRLRVLGQGWSFPTDVELPRGRDFICSTLVQYALRRTAQLVGKEAVYDVDATPPWFQFLPKHFAAPTNLNGSISSTAVASGIIRARAISLKSVHN
jgi:UDP-2,3-diacylglucosamine pyrophosphatase LpxH